MSNYIQSTNFATKDSLPSGFPANANSGGVYQTLSTNTKTTGITVATSSASTGSSGTNANL